MKHTHLTEAQLIASCVDGAPPPAAPDGAAGCAACQARLASLATLLNEVQATAAAAADAAFPPERLARQHARILSRLVPHRQIARIIAFPHARHTSMPPARPIRRWVAGAAAAGLVVGMVAGHLAHELPMRHRPTGPPAMLARVAVPEYTSVEATSDDDFLREIEQALSSSPAGLRQLDRLTPGAWEPQ